MALVFTDPPSRGGHRNGGTSPALANLRAQLAEFLAGSGEESERMDFRYVPVEERPRIVQPWRRLALVWQGRELALRGYLDVYLTLIV